MIKASYQGGGLRQREEDGQQRPKAGINLLVVGGGGREHAICWKLAQSPGAAKIWCAPGNAGIAQVAECVNIAADDVPGIVAFCREQRVDLVVVGPEAPLAMGLVDELEAAGIRAFGPNRSCARLEASKAFTKAFLARHGIPTAGYRAYTDLSQLKEDAGIFGWPMVIKADGLAAGKGVVIAENREEALRAMDEMMGDRIFGAAGDRVVVEEFLEGTEASVLCFVDESTIVPMESAQDYKRIFDGDRGPNTGGMGTYSPSLIFTPELSERIRREILEPTLRGFQKDGLRFRGVLFIGLMIRDGAPKVIEFNNRFGDPETQSLLPRLESDLLEVFLAITENRLSQTALRWSPQRAVCVVMAAKGYPGAYEKNRTIHGLDAPEEGVLVFHAGTESAMEDGERRIVTAGGRVLGVTALGATHEEARAKAYRAVGVIGFEGAQYRRDIGLLRL